MDAVSAAAATAVPIASAATAAATTTSSSATTATTKSFTTLFAEAEKTLKSGETLTKVDGHQFARIKGGERDAMCVNLSGNGRNGEAFDLVTRNGHQFHVYGGTGKDHVVVEVGKKAAATTGSSTADSTGGTSATGTTTTSATTTPASTTTDPTAATDVSTASSATKS
ncbi:MAG: hypothetical protein QOK49_1493 [Baekduia sp.]|jgi:hypothetical protein|nr:hypothetical protein [Baekduia sp.]